MSQKTENLYAQAYTHVTKEAADIRETVFLKEQGFESEYDHIDDIAVHIVLFEGDTPVGCCRYFQQDGEYYIGRLAVLRPYRNRAFGARLMAEAQMRIQAEGAKRILLHAQCDKQGFYEKQGYTAFGDIGYEEHCPHVWMEKRL